jgi:Uri superfamily endonuclease
MPKFGSTDCACETHLHYFETCDVAALISYVKKSAVARYFDCYETLAQRAKRKAVNSV